MNPLVGAALVNAGASLVSGILGNKSQKQTNAANLQIARENNQTSIDIANRNNEMSYKMFLEQLKYASPAEQRRMLEEAGYNPNLYALGATAQAPSAPSLQQPNLTTPTMVAPMALGQSINDLGRSVGSLYRDVAEAKLLDAQRQGVDIDNETKHYKNLAELNNIGLVNEALKLDWSWKLQTQEDRVLSVRLDNLIKDQEQKLYVARVAHEEIDNETRKQINEKTIQQVDAAINLLLEQGLTEVSKQNLNYAGISETAARIARMAVQNAIDKYDAETRRMVGSSQSAANYAQASYTQTLDMIEKRFGSSVKDAQSKQMRAYARLLENQNVSEYDKRDAIVKGIELCNKQIEYYEKTNNFIGKKMWMEILTGYSNAAANMLGASARMVDALVPF